MNSTKNKTYLYTKVYTNRIRLSIRSKYCHSNVFNIIIKPYWFFYNFAKYFNDSLKFFIDDDIFKFLESSFNSLLNEA